MSSLQKSVLKSKLPPIAPLQMGARRGAARKTKNYTPTIWSKYFQQKRDIQVSETDVFRVYSSGSSTDGSPVICLLHGGGFSALTWSLFTTSVVSMVHCEVLALDLRGHGGTVTSDDTDLSAETLAHDIGRVLNHLYPQHDIPILLIGHSMGGAIAVHVAHMELVPSLAGVAVIDVVEGTAMDALASMQSFLRGRPSQFKSLEHAIEWCVRSGQIRNVDSARVSMPGQLKNAETGKEAIDDIDGEECSQVLHSPDVVPENIIQEEEDESKAEAGNSVFKTPPTPVADTQASRGKYVWRIDLGKTEKYWPEWFSGLSAKYLNLCVPRMLLLAGIDRLDKELTVGQMQGKFQMQVLPQCGHTVHEDLPDRVAEIIATFLVRHKLAEPAGNFERSFPAC